MKKPLKLMSLRKHFVIAIGERTFKSFSSKTKMAEKNSYQHGANSSIPFYTAGWDIEEARKLIEESQRLNPRPIIIFVHPCANQLTFTWDSRDRQNSSLQQAIARTTSRSMTAEPQRRMGRIKITEEDYKQITGSEYNRRRRK